MLTKEQILAPRKQVIETVHVKKWGGSVGVKVMTAGERDAWEAAAFVDGKVNRENFRARLLVHTVCDDQGAPLFTSDDIPALAQQESPAVVRLVKKAMEINALSDGDVDDLTKN